MALCFVLLAIAALVAVPWLGARQTRPLYDELTDVVAPARGLVTGINYSLAVEGLLLREYLASRDESLTARYRAAYARELDASGKLAQLVEGMGPIAKRALEDFVVLQRNWHDRIDRLLRSPAAASTDDLRWERDYGLLFEALVRLDQALENAGDLRRAEIERLERVQEMIALALGALAASAALVVGWLAHRLRDYAAQLERRTADLERATESRARLMRGVTHDLKNPLHVIDGYAALLEEGLQGQLNTVQLDGVRRLRRSAREMLGLVNDLLDLARAEAGQLRITPAPVNLAQLCRELAQEYRPVAESAGLSLAPVTAPDEVPAMTDPARVRQVLENLMSNAIKYTPPGGAVSIGIDVRPREDDTPARVAISVTDTGHGVPSDQQSFIFADFTRLDSHADVAGAGLGLSISQRIAGLLGGEITLQSEVGQGSTFTVWLPQDRRQATA